jgi:tRNA nucleotidyltransferase/poly(A) polymerase
MLLGCPPKDFDILTSATPVQVHAPASLPVHSDHCSACLACAGLRLLECPPGEGSKFPSSLVLQKGCHQLQVKRLFGNCRIVGKRFPIVQLTMDGKTLEVCCTATRAHLPNRRMYSFFALTHCRYIQYS